MTLSMLSAVVLLTTITAAQANKCPGGSACASNHESPNVVVSMLQTKLQINVLGSAAEEASSDAFNGETNLDEKALNVATQHDPHAMLTEVEDMVRSGETPAFDVVSKIKDLIEYEMKPGLANMRNLTTQDTLDFSASIQLCNDQSKTKEDAIEGDMQVVVNDARSVHAACRDSEKAMYEHNLTNDDSYCVKLGKFLHEAAQLTLHIPPDARTRDSSVQYVEQAGNTNMCGGSQVRGLADNCTAQEEGLRSKSDDCKTKQGSFEVDFCTWKTQLETNCETLDTCHAAAVTAYDKHVAKTRTLMQKWDAESASLAKILCYCNAWLNKTDAADNRSQHNSTQLDACRDESYTPLPVNYGTRPEKNACLLTSVANFPGTSGFITQEYNSFLDFVDAAVPCPQATTAAPTTAVPTTTQAATTTAMSTMTMAPITFTSNQAWTAPQTAELEVLVVGGGAGGGGRSGGGGGGGSVLLHSGFTVNAGQSYQVIVGSGGAGGSGVTLAANGGGSNGGDSSFGSLVAKGGGGGASDNHHEGWVGGNGGGGKYGSAGGEAAQQTVPAGATIHGNRGGSGTGWRNQGGNGGGGGGAGSPGQSGTSTLCGNGGDGLESCISQECKRYGGGGGGASHNPRCLRTSGAGGLGGGGSGGSHGAKNDISNQPGDAGVDGLGGGGGGGSTDSHDGGAGGRGGNGIVIIRVKSTTTA